MEALEEEVRPFDLEHLSFGQRSKFKWNEVTIQTLQTCVRDQAISMTLLLQAIQLYANLATMQIYEADAIMLRPTPQARGDNIASSQAEFRKSDESAYSIVPSCISSRLERENDDGSMRSSEDFLYRPLSFEDDLFNGMVYKRNLIKYKLKNAGKRRIRRRDSALMPGTTISQARSTNTEFPISQIQDFNPEEDSNDLNLPRMSPSLNSQVQSQDMTVSSADHVIEVAEPQQPTSSTCSTLDKRLFEIFVYYGAGDPVLHGIASFEPMTPYLVCLDIIQFTRFTRQFCESNSYHHGGRSTANGCFGPRGP